MSEGEILEVGPVVPVRQPSLVYRFNDDRRCYEIIEGPLIIADEGPTAMAVYGRWALQVEGLHRTDLAVAHVGGGTYVMPRLLEPYAAAQTVMEIRDGIIQFGQRLYGSRGWVLVLGDYRVTLPRMGLFDVIAYDGAEAPNEELLAAHLAPGGVILRWEP